MEGLSGVSASSITITPHYDVLSLRTSSRVLGSQVVRRVSLQQLMPTVGAVLKNVTKEMEIQEPTYKDVVVLYRRTVPDKPVKKSDRDPVIACDKVSLKTCQVTKRDRAASEACGHLPP